jgi:hypothetical protein
MTLAEAGEIFGYWERDPPAHLIVQTIARMLGWSPQPLSTRRPRIEEIAASAPPGLVIRPDGVIGMPAPILDPEALRAQNRVRAAAVARRHQNGGVPLLPRTLGGA